MTLPRIMFCGEALIDFITSDGSIYHATPGGAPYSASKAASQAGAQSSFCGAISRDLFGEQIADDLARHGVDTTFAARLDHPTVLAFIQVSDAEHPKYAFLDRDSTMVNMKPSLPAGTLRAGDMLVLGSISLVVSPGADNIVEFALKESNAATLAVDPNVRPGIISSHQEWRPRMDRLLSRSDMVRVSTEDLEFYAPDDTPEQFANARLSEAAGLVIVTDGENGAEAFSRSGHAAIGCRKAAGGDTVGAGDTLMGYSLAWLAENDLTGKEALADLGDDALHQMLRLASCAAEMNCEAVGCNPPVRSDVDTRIDSR